jgi:hypothetical protein
MAGMTFWNDTYAIKLGVRSDGVFGFGGWSRGNNWSWYSSNTGDIWQQGSLTMDGQTTRLVQVERNSTANTVGQHLYVKAGGATTASTDKAGGSIIIQPGISTGTAGGTVYIQGNTPGATGTADSAYTTIIQVTGNKLGFFGATPVARAAATTAPTANAPAGGTGLVAGAWSTAANRDIAIAAINNLMTRVQQLETIITNLGLSL